MYIFLSIGHSILRNGVSTSANGFVNEYRYNKALAPYVRDEIIRRGHKCDVIQVPEYTYKSARSERGYKMPIADSGKYDLVCELHLNASNGKGYGSEVLYYTRSSESKKIATNICTQLGKLGFRNRGIKNGDWLYMVGATKETAILIESFFCDNKGDCDRAKELGYRKIANAIANGLLGENRAVDNKPVKPAQKEGNYSVLTNTPNDVLNVRQEPNATSRIVSSYRNKSKIYVHEVVKNNSGTWYKIEYKKGRFGYVSARYCVGIK